MMRRLTRLVLSLAVLLAVAAPAVPAFASTNVFQDVKSICKENGQGANGSAVCKTSAGDGFTSKNGVLHRATVIIASLAGIAAVIVLGVGGLRYITSNGDAEQIAKAKRTIIYALVGLAIIILGQGIINFVISRI